MRRTLVVLVLALIGCTVAPVPQPSPPSAPTVQPEALIGVGIDPLGAVSGDWAVVLRSASGYGAPDEGELWAVPLAGGEAKRVVIWTSHGIGSYEAVRLGLTVIRRQLSPDRRRVVLTVTNPYGSSAFSGRLATIDLFTGRFGVLDTPNVQMVLRPAWSPDGKRIAFDRYDSTFWTGISVIGADNTGLRRLCDATAGSGGGLLAFRGCYGVGGWTPDSRAVAFYEVDGYSVIDADTGATTRFAGVHGASLIAADWRDASPAVALAIADGNERALLTFDRDGSSLRTVARAPAGSLGFFEPRWNPQRDEILVRRGGELFVYGGAASGRRVAAVTCDVRGEWHPGGSEVVYLAPCLGTGELRIATAAVAGAAQPQSGDRFIWAPPSAGRSDWRVVDLAVVRYP